MATYLGFGIELNQRTDVMMLCAAIAGRASSESTAHGVQQRDRLRRSIFYSSCSRLGHRTLKCLFGLIKGFRSAQFAASSNRMCTVYSSLDEPPQSAFKIEQALRCEVAHTCVCNI